MPVDKAEIARIYAAGDESVKDRIRRAGLAPGPQSSREPDLLAPKEGPSSSQPPEKPSEGEPFGRKAARIGGGALGAIGGALIPGFGEIGGPVVGAGVGTAGGGALYDKLAGRSQSLERAAKEGVGGAASELVGGQVMKYAGKAGGAVVRAGAKRFPTLGRAAEGIVPRILRHGARAGEEVSAIDAPDVAGVTALYEKASQAAGGAPTVQMPSLTAAIAGGPVPSNVGLSPAGREAMALVEAGKPITFDQAHTLEKELGKLTNQRLPFHSAVEHELRTRYAAVRDDLADFLSTNPVAGEALGEAKGGFKLKLGQERLDETIQKATSPQGGFNRALFIRRYQQMRPELEKLLPADRLQALDQLASEMKGMLPKARAGSGVEGSETRFNEYVRRAWPYLLSGGLGAEGYRSYQHGGAGGLGREGALAGAGALALTSPGQALLRAFLPQLLQAEEPPSFHR